MEKDEKIEYPWEAVALFEERASRRDGEAFRIKIAEIASLRVFPPAFTHEFCLRLRRSVHPLVRHSLALCKSVRDSIESLCRDYSTLLCPSRLCTSRWTPASARDSISYALSPFFSNTSFFTLLPLQTYLYIDMGTSIRMMYVWRKR